ncbi:MAG: NAD(P)H-hydrate dehydratase [Syntrophomonadaceae bacterium]|nr:NAD(P)H-hydrate dehydratase [Syntrophomonadaceae bacterium]
MKLIRADEMKEIDRRASSEYLIPSIVLMENAGLRTTEKIAELLDGVGGRNIIILVGRGNNGGDGLVVARHLLNAAARVNVFMCGEVGQLSPDARTNYEILARMTSRIYPLREETDLQYFIMSLLEADMVVDAIYGIGFRGSLGEFEARLAGLVNQSKCPLLAVDIPSGLEADTGRINGEAFKADYTVTFALPKLGMVLGKGRDYVGQLTVADISIPGALLLDEQIKLQMITEEMVKLHFQPRLRETHKGSYGHALIIGGSPGMSGAPVMASWAALRCGTGLVTLALPEKIMGAASVVPEVMSRGLPSTLTGAISGEACTIIENLLGTASVCAIGPGMSRYAEGNMVVRTVLEKAGIPVLIDADGLNALQSDVGILKDRQVPVVITPHPGEMSRLTKLSVEEIQNQRIEISRHYSVEWGVTIVLKGNNTIVALPGGQVFVNVTGNPGMATAGSGDVLSGIITGLIAQGLKPTDAAVAGVFLHGRAGDTAARQLGQRSITATDLIYSLPTVINELEMKAK